MRTNHPATCLPFVFITSIAFAQSFGELGSAPIAPPRGAPGVLTIAPSSSWFDTSSRAAIQNLYLNLFQGFQNVAYGWTGDVVSCTQGTLSQDYIDAAALRFNWVRGVSGVPAGITMDTVTNGPADQQAALMMSANAQLSHMPP